MKKYVVDFIKRGWLASVGGPIIYAIVMLILGICGVEKNISIYSVVIGITTSAVLAFIAAGVSVVYNIEKLNLLTATSIHALVLYLDYVLIYLLNGWLISKIDSILIFTGVYIAAYIIVWIIIYFSIKQSVKNLNKKIGQ